MMEVTPEIRFRGMDPSPAVEAAVRERMERLERFHDRITSCTVVIEAPHQHSWKGKIYHVRIDITVPGAEIVVGREPEENQAHEDVYVAIRDQFDAGRRQLEDVVRRMSGHRAKPHPPLEQYSDEDERRAWLDRFLQRHYPPAEDERALIVEHIERMIAEE